MIWKNGTETCILSYVKQIASPGSMHETGSSGLGHWDDPEAWGGGSGWGTHVHPWLIHISSVQFSSVTQSCPTLCHPMNRSTPGLPVHHQLPEFTQTHVHRVSDAIQPSHPLSSPSPPALNPSQHQSFFPMSHLFA